MRGSAPAGSRAGSRSVPTAGRGRPGLPDGERRGFTCGADRAGGGGPGTGQPAAAGGSRAAPPPGRRLTYPGPRGSMAATLRQMHEQQRQQERASPCAAPGPRHHGPSGEQRRGSGGTAGLCGHRRRLSRAAAAQPGSGVSVSGRRAQCPGPALPLPPQQVTRLGHGDARYKAAAGRGRAALTAVHTYRSAAARGCSQ